MRYPREFRENLLRQILTGERSVKELSEKHRVHTGTLYRWLCLKRDGEMRGRRSGMRLRAGPKTGSCDTGLPSAEILLKMRLM